MKDTSNAQRSYDGGHTIARNTLYNLFGRGLPLLAGLAVTPFVVRWLGEARFGLFSIGMAVVATFFVFDLGLGRAVAKFGAAYRGSGRESDIPSLLWSAVWLQLVLGALAGMVFFLATPLLVRDFLSIPDAMHQEATHVFLLLGATVVLSLTEFSFAGTLEAYQRFGAINLVRGPLNVLSLLFIVWVAYAERSLAFFFAFFLGTRVAISLLLLALCARTVPDLFSRGRPTRDSLHTLLHFGKWITVSNLVAPALLYADRFLLGSLGTLGQVAYYTAPFQVVERLLIIPGTLTSTLFPAVSALDSSKQGDDVARLAGQAMHYLLCVMGLGASVLAGAAPWLVWFFFGESYLAHSVSVFQILLLGFSVNALAFIPFSVVQGCGRPDITAKFHLIEFPIHLALLWAGFQLAGLPGVAWAWTTRVSLDFLLLMFICVRKGWMRTALLAEQGTLRSGLVYGIAGATLSLIAREPTLPRLGAVAVGSVLVAVYTYYGGLGATGRAQVRDFLQRRRGQEDT